MNLADLMRRLDVQMRREAGKSGRVASVGLGG